MRKLGAPAEWSAGSATINDWRYDEAGNVFLAASSTSYLGAAGADVSGDSGLDGTGAAGGYIGRFRPKQFAVSAATLTHRSDLACSAGFTYMDEPLKLVFGARRAQRRHQPHLAHRLGRRADGELEQRRGVERENALGPEASVLPVPIRLEYWNGSGFATNALDSCTSLARSDIALDFSPPTAPAAMSPRRARRSRISSDAGAIRPTRTAMPIPCTTTTRARARRSASPARSPRTSSSSGKTTEGHVRALRGLRSRTARAARAGPSRRRAAA